MQAHIIFYLHGMDLDIYTYTSPAWRMSMSMFASPFPNGSGLLLGPSFASSSFRGLSWNDGNEGMIRKRRLGTLGRRKFVSMAQGPSKSHGLVPFYHFFIYPLDGIWWNQHSLSINKVQQVLERNCMFVDPLISIRKRHTWLWIKVCSQRPIALHSRDLCLTITAQP